MIQRKHATCSAHSAPRPPRTFRHSCTIVLYFVTWSKYSDDFAAARAAVVALIAELRERNEEGMLAPPLFQAGELDAGRATSTSPSGTPSSCMKLRSEPASRSCGRGSLYLDALVDTYRGRVDAARDAATTGLALAEEGGDLRLMTRQLATLGFLELSRGDAAAAHKPLARARTIAVRAGYGEPGMVRFAADAVEAMIALGDLDSAREQLKELEEQGRRLDRAWAIAAAGRCRGLLAAASRGLRQRSRCPRRRSRSPRAPGSTGGAGSHPARARNRAPAGEAQARGTRGSRSGADRVRARRSAAVGRSNTIGACADRGPRARPRMG